jgi:hypothetical protein
VTRFDRALAGSLCLHALFAATLVHLADAPAADVFQAFLVDENTDLTGSVVPAVDGSEVSSGVGGLPPPTMPRPPLPRAFQATGSPRLPRSAREPSSTARSRAETPAAPSVPPPNSVAWAEAHRPASSESAVGGPTPVPWLETAVDRDAPADRLTGAAPEFTLAEAVPGGQASEADPAVPPPPAPPLPPADSTMAGLTVPKSVARPESPPATSQPASTVAALWAASPLPMPRIERGNLRIEHSAGGTHVAPRLAEVREPAATLRPPGPDARVTPAPRAKSSELTAGAGSGVTPLLLHLEGSRDRLAQQETETVSGRITGGTAARLTLYQNGIPRDVPTQGGTFQVGVSLQPGANHLRVVVADARGARAEDAVTVRYVPPIPGDGIRITSPTDGHRVLGDAPPIVVVEGQVDDHSVATIALFANKRRITVPARNGRFRHVMPLFDPVVNIWAETPPNGSPGHRSQTVLVGLAPNPAQSAVVVLDWSEALPNGEVEVSALWRGRPERIDPPVQTGPVQPFGPGQNGAPPEVFHFRQVRPGVYTLVLRYRGTAPSEARPTLFLTDGREISAKVLKPVALIGGEHVVLVKILLPQGILWEQDDWFTGSSESVDTVTKFRLPEGITWTEPKGERR